ncbi:MAG: hypothetical protein V4649_18675 [Bacteroidota bacterium]
MTLREFIPETTSYHLGKLSDGLYENDKLPLSKASLSILVSITRQVKAEVETKYKGGMNALSGLSIVLSDMEYEAARLAKWMEEGELYKNDDARVFIHSYATNFKKFNEIVHEVDDILDI